MENSFNPFADLPEADQEKYLECLVILIESGMDDPERLKTLMQLNKQLAKNQEERILNKIREN